MIFCWKVKNDEYGITKVKEKLPCLGSKQESLEHVVKRVFNQINFDNSEEFAVLFVFSLKNMVYRYYLSRAIDMIERKMLRRFFEGKDVIYKYKYNRWLPDSVFYPKVDSISHFRAPYSSGLGWQYLELSAM